MKADPHFPHEKVGTLAWSETMRGSTHTLPRLLTPLMSLLALTGPPAPVHTPPTTGRHSSRECGRSGGSTLCGVYGRLNEADGITRDVGVLDLHTVSPTDTCTAPALGDVTHW